MITSVKVFHANCLLKFLFILLLVATFLPQGVLAQNADEIAVRQLLDEQTKAWNRGNIDEFMKGYWQSDSLVFIGKSGPKWGYSTTLENYKKSYPDTTAMGKLHFDILQMKRLSFQYYFVIGKFHLERSIGNLEGHFTLLFKKVKNSWKIISDHTSG